MKRLPLYLFRRFAPRGSALLIVMVLIMALGLALTSLTSFTSEQRTANARMQLYEEELTAAESALDALTGQVHFYAQSKPRQVGGTIDNLHTAILALEDNPPTIEGFEYINVDVECIEGDDLSYKEINDPSDENYGFVTLLVEYRITVQLRSTSTLSDRLEHPGVALQRMVQLNQIPIYAYAIFYGNDLELDAGQRIDVVGRVHTNGNFYLTTSSEAYYHRAITVAGNFYGGIYSPGSGRLANNDTDVFVTRDGGSTNFSRVYGTATNASTWLDSRTSNWVPESNARWTDSMGRKFLRDKAHGIQTIGMPIPQSENPHRLIEPTNAADEPAVADVKFSNIASVKITGTPTNASTISIQVNGVSYPNTYTVGGVTKTIVSTASIYNGREAKTVDMLDVNIANMVESGINVGDGVIYIEPTAATSGSRQSAVRLNNAGTVPTNVQGGLTIATNGPMYTKGNVNTSGDTILLLASDAINILSADFNDSLYQTSAQASRPRNAAAQTTTNAIFMAGNVPSAGNRYSGGAENFFRYLELWGSSRQHVFNGSLLNLYQSQIATGPWDQNPAANVQSSPYYSPPRRIWSWDPDLAGITPPPGFPSFLVIKNLDWEIVTPESA